MSDFGEKTITNVPVNEDFLFDVGIEARELAPVYWLGPVYEGVLRLGTGQLFKETDILSSPWNLVLHRWLNSPPLRRKSCCPIRRGRLNTGPFDDYHLTESIGLPQSEAMVKSRYEAFAP